MRLVLILSAVGITILALRIFFALKTAHTDAPQGQKTSREEKTVPANTGGPLSGADARAAQVSRLQCLRRFPPEPSGKKLKGRKCGSIATTVGWCSARIIGFIFGRTFSSGIESPLPRPIPSLLALPSKAASVSSAMTAAENISINPQKCSNTNRNFLTLSLPIRYFEIVRGWWPPGAIAWHSPRGWRTTPARRRSANGNIMKKSTEKRERPDEQSVNTALRTLIHAAKGPLRRAR